MAKMLPIDEAEVIFLKEECPIRQNISGVVDKQCLAEGVKLRNQGTLAKFAGGKQICGEEMTLNSITFEKLGDIKVPVSLLDIRKLHQISLKASNGKGYNSYLDPLVKKALWIDSSHVVSTVPENFDLSSLVARLLGLPTDLVDVQARLDQLILYGKEGHYKRVLDLKKEIGTFGTAILQIPVEGGHEGGCLKVEYNGREESFDNHQGSHLHYFLTAFYNSCHHAMEPVTQGWKLTIVFSLFWTNAQMAEIPHDWPVFLSALKKVKRALVPWIRLKESGSLNNFGSPVEYNSLNAQPDIPNMDFTTDVPDYFNREMYLEMLNRKVQDDLECSSDIVGNEFQAKKKTRGDETLNQQGKNQETDVHVPDYIKREVYLEMLNRRAQFSSDDEEECSSGIVDSASQAKENSLEVSEKSICKDEVLFFVLEEKYEENNFTFNCLRGKDRDLAHLLQSLPFLELHLARVKHSVTTERRSHYRYCNSCHGQACKKTNTKITHWIDLNDLHVNLDINFDWERQSVGSIRNLLASSGIHPDEQSVVCQENCDKPIRIKHYLTSILVIWPKCNSFKMYCRHGLHSILNRIENSLNSTVREQEDARKKATHDLKKIISFCCKDPLKVWGKPAVKKGELTRKLLSLCIALRARQEGLALLKMLGSDFVLPPGNSGKVTYEGIQSIQVARAIAEFECYVSGWNDCTELIRQMISPSRISKQFVPIIKLVEYLLEVDCAEGAKVVGNFISSSLVNIDRRLLSSLTLFDVKAYIDMIVSLEADFKTSNQERMTTFVFLFPKLESSLQCRLVLDLEAQGSSRLKGIKSCQFMFHEMCKALPNCNLRAPSIEDTMVVDVLKCYVRLGNAGWIKILTSNICRMATAAGTFGESIVLKNETLGNIISSTAIWELATSSELGKSVVVPLVDAQLTLVDNQLLALGNRNHPEYLLWEEYRKGPLFRLLSTCIRLKVQLEKQLCVQNSPLFTSAISSLMTKLNVQQVWEILVDVLKSNSEHLKGRPFIVAITRQMCDLLLLHLKKNLSALPQETILETVKCFIQFGEESLTRQLL